MRYTPQVFLDLLEQYIATEILPTCRPKQPLWRRSLQTLVILFGVAWGIPWIWVSMAAANALFSASLAPSIALLFAMGIVITVGADGWWIMREASHALNKSSASAKALLEIQYGRTAIRMTKGVFAWLFATLSCIAPVYATLTYASHTQQLFAIITLVGYYGYGLIGYNKLIEQISCWLNDRHNLFAALQCRAQLIHGIHVLAQHPVTHLDARELIVKASSLPSPAVATNKQPWRYSAKPLRLAVSLLIACAASLVSIFLIHDFLYRYIWSNPAFAIIAAIMAEIPGFVISILATYRLVGRLFITSAPLIVSATLPLLARRTLLLLPATLALLAPTAAGYIAYATLTAHHITTAIVVLGVVAISLARVIFSWFTLTHLTDYLLAKMYAVRGQPDLEQQARVHAFADRLSRIPAQYFQAVAAGKFTKKY